MLISTLAMAQIYPAWEYSESVSTVTVFPITISSMAIQVAGVICSPNTVRSVRAMPIGERDLRTERMGREISRRAAALVKM